MGTGPTNTPGDSQPSSPALATHNKKKKGGLLALLNCCGVPDHANGLNTEQDQVHRVEKLAPRPTTASRRTLTPSDQPSSSKTQLQEKEAQPQAGSQNAPGNSTAEEKEKRESAISTQNQSTVSQAEAESKHTTLVGNSTTAPAVTVDPPNATSSETTEPAAVAVIEAEEPRTADEADAEGDIPMPDADEAATQPHEQSVLTQANEHQQQYTAPLPPPPSGPIPAAAANPPTSHLQEQMPPFVPDQPTKYLLPPQAPEFKGKKCLVLDLDETLVHSSFKVGYNTRSSIQPWDITG
jgi:RNA polymerase II subunit A small phosphatase-like protein